MLALMTINFSPFGRWRVTKDQVRSYYVLHMVRITTRKQFFMPGELPLVLLALIAGRPQGGYELMGELERRYGPAYRPSPGSVYPALSALRAEQLVAPYANPSAERPLTACHRIGSPDAGRATRRGHQGRVADKRPARARRLPAARRRPLRSTRASKFSGRVDRAAVERILDTAAKAIADLEVSSGQ